MNKLRLLSIAALISTALFGFSAPQSAMANAATAGQRVVLAHYMPNFGAYGNNVAGYKHDIQDAQSTGVDGFALDMMGWGTDTARWANFQQEAADMFTAASQLGTGFKLFFNLDCHGYGYDSKCISAAGQMLTAYGNHPNYYHYQGRPVFSGWSAGLNPAAGSADGTFWTAVINSIQSTGLSPVFMPVFSNWTLTYPRTESWFANGWLNGAVQGLMNWGDMIPTLFIENNDSFFQVAANHKIAIASAVESWHAPIRFLSTGQVSNDMNVIEFNGGEGAAAIWEDIINDIRPSIVYLVTWNDYTESYMGPASKANLTAHNLSEWQVTPDYLNLHAAYTDLNRYFIQWYKTGIQPTWPDAMYVFYRNASTKMVATGAPAGTYIGWNTQGNPTLDDIYITTILTAPAALTVTSGNRTARISVPEGVSHARVPFRVGSQTFTLSRDQNQLIRITGDPIVSSESHYYNVNPLTYYGYSPSGTK